MKDSLALVKSLIFKDERYIDPTNPDEYYNNLQGDKQDNEILYTLDVVTGSTIMFDKHIKENYRETWEELIKFDNEYKILLNKYPKRRNYIRGCLLPVDKEIALGAEHGDVIGYNSNLLEAQETNIIPNINDVYKSAILKYNSNMLSTKVDKYHELMVEANVIITLPLIVFNTRLANKGTIRMSTYYLNEELYNKGISYGAINILTYSQKMWLYNNLSFITTSSLSNEVINKFISKLFLNQSVYRLVTTAVSVDNNALLPNTVLTTLYDNTPIATKTLNEIKGLIEADRMKWNNDNDNPYIPSLTGLYYLDSRFNIAELIAPELNYNLWGNLAFANEYRNTISFTYPFNDSNSKRYTLDTKEAFIYVRVLQRLLGNNKDMPLHFEVNDSLTIYTPSLINKLDLYVPKNITSLTSFLEAVEKVKNNYRIIYNNLHLSNGDDLNKHIAEFEVYQSSKLYPIGGGLISDWLDSNHLPDIRKQDIPLLITLITSQALGTNTSEISKLELLKETFDDITPYNIQLLIKQPNPLCDIPVISMSTQSTI